MPEQSMSEMMKELQEGLDEMSQSFKGNKKTEEKTQSNKLAIAVVSWMFTLGVSAVIIIGIAWLTKIAFFS